jgi:4a-hydroxytetrahydrobiopterin dehydratase
LASLLGREEVEKKLRTLDGWKAEGGFLVKKFEFSEFMDGIGFVGKVAALAERLDHHPDISVRYTTVTLSVQTHSEGGITEKDFRLARAVDGLGWHQPAA